MGRRPRAEDSAPIEDLIDSLPRPEPRADLGNFPEETPAKAATSPEPPDDADTAPAPSPTEPERPAVAAPAPTPDADTAPDEPDDTTPVGEPAPASPELEALRSQVAQLTQQVDFFRQGAQRAQPSPEQLLQQVLTPTGPIVPFQISPQDVRTLVENPEQAAAMLNQAFHVFGQHLTQQILNQGAGLMNVREQLRGRETQANDYFWQGNADLTDLAPYVQAYAQQLQQSGQTDPHAILAEAGRRVRMQFGRFQAMPGTPAPKRGRAAKAPAALGAPPSRVRPAFSERSTGARVNGAARLTPVEADILDLARQ